MTAAAAATAIHHQHHHQQHPVVASILTKVEQGTTVSKNDLEELRDAVRKNPKIIPYLDRSFLNGGRTNNHHHSPPPPSTVLVRCVGMVQDQLETEYYLSEKSSDDGGGIKLHYRDAAPLLSEQHGNNDNDDNDHTTMMDVAHKLAERQPLVVVPIPFTSNWIRERTMTTPSSDIKKQQNNDQHQQGMVVDKNNQNNDKRQGEDIVEDPPMAKRKAAVLSSTPDTSMEADDDSMEEEQGSSSSQQQRHAPSFKKKNKAAAVDVLPSPSTVDWWPAGCLQSDPQQCPILAKLYYEQQECSSTADADARRLRLNEVVELVGVLSMDPTEADFSTQQQQSQSSSSTTTGIVNSFSSSNNDEWNDVKVHDFSVALPPPSLLPRLHVLCFNRVNLERMPYGTTETNDGMDVDLTSSTTTTITDDRRFCIRFLAEHVFGGGKNEIAAEALLMVLMSMAEREEIAKGTWAPIKTPVETTLGCASLNLILPSQASCSKLCGRLRQVLQQILPVVCTIDLCRKHLGKTVVSPAKNESGRFDPQSPLQLPRGSALVVNESMLTEGAIDTRAEETLRAMQSLTKSHCMPYRFEGMMNYNFEADYRVIVLSDATVTPRQQGSKLLPCSMTMPLSDEAVPSDSAPRGLSIPEDDVQRIRSYLALCRCNPSKQVPDEVFNVPLSKTLLELAQKDFVDKRASYRKRVEQRKRMQAIAVAGAASEVEDVESKVGEADFHRWLTVARLQERSHFPSNAIPSDESVDKQTWEDTLCLDEAMNI